ncbi:hypothetical protein ACLOJK_007136 [Asimina triloba]
MAPKKVTCTTPTLKVREEQPVIPQHEEGGHPPPRESPEDVVTDILGVPPVGPLETFRQCRSDVDGSVTRAELRALVKMMRALQQQLSRSQQQ